MHIKVNVSVSDCPRYRNKKGNVATNVFDVCSQKGKFIFVMTGWEGYRNRKGNVATNVFGVCSQNGEFIFDMSGWEGFVFDLRVLRAISRPTGLKVPRGKVMHSFFLR